AVCAERICSRAAGVPRAALQRRPPASLADMAPSASQSQACSCGGYHATCRMRDMATKLAADPPAKATKENGFDRMVSSASTTASQSDHAASPSSLRAGAAGDVLFIPAVGNENSSESVLGGGGVCACGGFHRACRLRDTVLVDPAQPPPAPDPVLGAGRPSPKAGGPSSAAVVGGEACRCGGYHRACRLGPAGEAPAPAPAEPAPAAVEGGVGSAAVAGTAACRRG
ncbi:unnamed protein product, partial [Prorocentrum cordatum]